MNTNNRLAQLPSLPRSSRKNRAVVPCACGCGMGTKSTWFPGHDGRATGWAVRVEKGIIDIEGIPENERRGALIMLTRRGSLPEGVEGVRA